MKQFRFLLFILLAICISCGRNLRINGLNKVSLEKLYGNWEFIHIYEGELTNIDTLKNKSYKSSFKSYTNYSKDGTFRFQGCYVNKGKYTLDKENYLIKEYYDENVKEVATGRIIYLDENYLLIVYGENSSALSYFFKRNKL